VVQELARLLAGFDARPMDESGSKERRAEPFEAQAESGMVRLLRGAWNDAYVDELTTFPAGAHDDQVDATAGAFAALSHGNTGPLVGTMSAA
jgi:predicted phage terminase large subunit-like protein